ncbi:MAG: hypothetical protein VKP72_01935 [bacterium]|nr:hypothetical protein [bacterium]
MLDDSTLKSEGFALSRPFRPVSWIALGSILGVTALLGGFVSWNLGPALDATHAPHEIQRLIAEVNAYKRQSDQVAGNLSELTKKEAFVKSTLSALESRSTAAQQNINSLQATTTTLQSEKTRLVAELDSARAEASQLKSTIASLKAEQARTEQQVAPLRAQLAAAQKALDGLTTLRAEEAKLVSSELEQVRTTGQELQAIRTREMANIQAQIKVLQEGTSTLRDSWTQIASQQKALRDDITALSGQLKAMQGLAAPLATGIANRGGQTPTRNTAAGTVKPAEYSIKEDAADRKGEEPPRQERGGGSWWKWWSR